MKKALSGCEKTTLPIMPATAHDLEQQLSSNHSNNQALQRILMRDPAAVIALYQRVEQSRPGASQSITDPAHALSLLGHGPFKELLWNLPRADHQLLDGTPQAGFAYSQAAHAAWFARALGQAIGLANTEELAVAALLQQPAVLALWSTDHESARRATNAMRSGVPFETAFSAELGESLKQANTRLADTWHLPRLAREAMSDWDPFSRTAQTVALADMLAQTSFAGWEPDGVNLHLEVLEEYLGQTHHAVAAWWHQRAVEAARELAQPGYPLAAFELLLIPGGEEEVEIPTLPTWDGKITKTSAQSPKRGLQETLGKLMRSTQKEAGIKRAVFGMLNKDRTEVKARLALGGNKQDPMRRFCVNLRQRNLFSLLLGKQQSVWLNPGNREKYTPLLKELPLDGGSTKGFFAMSIFVQDKALGLLYADGGELNEQNYKRFRKLCAEVARTLERTQEAA